MRKSFFATVLTGVLYISFAEGCTISLDKEYDPVTEHPTASPRQNRGTTQTFLRVVNHTPSTITLGSEHTS